MTLDDRLNKLVHPYEGVLRGIINADISGKGGKDPDEKLVNISVGELREIYNVLQLLKKERMNAYSTTS